MKSNNYPHTKDNRDLISCQPHSSDALKPPVSRFCADLVSTHQSRDFALWRLLWRVRGHRSKQFRYVSQGEGYILPFAMSAANLYLNPDRGYATDFCLSEQDETPLVNF